MGSRQRVAPGSETATTTKPAWPASSCSPNLPSARDGSSRRPHARPPRPAVPHPRWSPPPARRR